MKWLAAHIRNNIVAYVALFVAMGGTSYAAFSIPRNSVGAPQIRNHSITHVKLNQKSIAGTVEAWVKLQWRGSRIVATGSSSRVSVANDASAENVFWPHRHFARACIASATPQVNLGSAARDGYVTAQFDPSNPAGAVLELDGFSTAGVASPQAVDVLIFCP